jgi:hypothetical protein
MKWFFALFSTPRERRRGWTALRLLDREEPEKSLDGGELGRRHREDVR